MRHLLAFLDPSFGHAQLTVTRPAARQDRLRFMSIEPTRGKQLSLVILDYRDGPSPFDPAPRVVRA